MDEALLIKVLFIVFSRKYFTTTMKEVGTVSKLNLDNKDFIAGHEKSHTASMGTDKLLCSYKASLSFLNPSKQIFRGRSSRQSVKDFKNGTI